MAPTSVTSKEANMLNRGINTHIFFKLHCDGYIIEYLMGNSKKPLPLGLQSLGISVVGWEEGEGEGNKEQVCK